MAFLNFVNAVGNTDAGINMDQVMSWSSSLDKDGTAAVIVTFAVMANAAAQGTTSQPWAMRLTGTEREQFLAYILRKTP